MVGYPSDSLASCLQSSDMAAGLEIDGLETEAQGWWSSIVTW